MKKLQIILLSLILGMAFAISTPVALGLGTGPTLYPNLGGTGSTTLTGILIGNGTNAVNTLTIGTNLTLSGTTLNATSGSTYPWPFPAQATTTILNLNGGVISSTYVDASRFVATTSAATSTFAGGINVQTGAFTVLQSNGGVGIGTQAPGSPLDILSATGPMLRVIDSGTAGANADPHIAFRDGTSQIGTVGFSTSNSNNLILANSISGGHILLTTTGVGNVGIGLTSPAFTLEVSGTSSTTKLFATLSTTTSATTTAFAISGITSGNCLHTTTGGAIVGTGADCVSGFAWPFPSSATTTLLTFNGGLIANASSSFVALNATNATTTNATTTAFNISSKSLTINSNSSTSYISGTTTPAFNIASTTLDALGKSFSIATSTFLLANYPEARVLDGFYCTASTTGTAIVNFSHDNGNKTEYSICTTGSFTRTATNNTWTSFEAFNVQASSTAGAVSRITITPVMRKTSN